LSPAIF